jgi:hypothetical protein
VGTGTAIALEATIGLAVGIVVTDVPLASEAGLAPGGVLRWLARRARR